MCTIYSRQWFQRRYDSMLMTIAIILLILWLGGFFLHIAGGLIHIILVIALIMFVLHFFTGRSGSV